MKKGISKYSYILMLGHVSADVTQGALPALLPFLILHNDLSYTMAAGLAFANSAMSSVIQPFFGHLGDRRAMPWLMALGVFLAGAGFALVGFMNSYPAMFVAVLVSGTGVALFHPEGGKNSNIFAGKNTGQGMGLFGAGGNIGFAAGPIILVAVITMFGMRGTAVFALIGIVIAVVIMVSLKRMTPIIEKHRARQKSVEATGESRDDWFGFIRCMVVVFGRSVLHYGLLVFIPLYWVAVFMQTEAVSSSVLALLSGVSILATIAGGNVADRFGFRKTVRVATIAFLPVLIILILTKSVVVATILIIPIAFCLNGPYGAMLALGQRCLPNKVGLASGISLGLSVSIGGMFSPVIGKMADLFGLNMAFYFLIAVVIIMIIFSILLPNDKAIKK